MSKAYGSSSFDIGICGFLAVFFIVLKWTGNINCSWWWALAPLAMLLATGGAWFVWYCWPKKRRT